MIGDRNDSATRLLDENAVRTFGMDFDKLRRIPAERRTLEVGISTQGGMVEMRKLDETTGLPRPRSSCR